MTGLNDLASLYAEQEKYAEAEPLVRQVLAFREQHLGNEHPDTVRCINNLSHCCLGLRNYSEAEVLLKCALDICERDQPGKVPKDLVTCLENLGACYIEQQRFSEAEPLLKRALALSEQQLGVKTITQASILHKLAKVYASRNTPVDALEAMSLMKRALTILERQQPGHPYTLQVRKEYTEAIQILRKKSILPP